MLYKMAIFELRSRPQESTASSSSMPPAIRPISLGPTAASPPLLERCLAGRYWSNVCRRATSPDGRLHPLETSPSLALPQA